MVKTSERTLVEFSIDTDGDGRADDTVTATDEHSIWVADLATVPAEEAFGANLAEAESTETAAPAAEGDGSGSGGGGPPAASLETTTEHESGPVITAGGPSDDHVNSPATADADFPGLWVNAIDLKTGQLLRTSAGTWSQITAVETPTEQVTVYNLTVADLHTYYVAAADTDFLTHNEECGGYLGNLTVSLLPATASRDKTVLPMRPVHD
ncbi:polymorphic toxin-type HINT domain-containing protein [Glycomyces tarimensis]